MRKCGRTVCYVYEKQGHMSWDYHTDCSSLRGKSKSGGNKYSEPRQQIAREGNPERGRRL